MIGSEFHPSHFLSPLRAGAHYDSNARVAMSTLHTRSCPACGTVMPASFPEGLCPKCLLAAAVPPEENACRVLLLAAPMSAARPDGVCRAW